TSPRGPVSLVMAGVGRAEGRQPRGDGVIEIAKQHDFAPRRHAGHARSTHDHKGHAVVPPHQHGNTAVAYPKGVTRTQLDHLCWRCLDGHKSHASWQVPVVKCRAAPSWAAVKRMHTS